MTLAALQQGFRARAVAIVVTSISLAATLVVGGCAASLSSGTTATAPSLQAGTGSTASLSTTSVESMTCRDLNGRMQLMILDMRGQAPPDGTSSLGQSLGKIFGGKSTQSGDYDARRSQLETYNNALAVKNCKYFDLQSELSNTDPNHTPVATLSGR